RGDAAPGPPRPHGRPVPPVPPRVHPAVRAGHRPRPAAARARDRHAPRPDDPGDGDRTGGRRLPPLHRHRTGRQRRVGAHGRALPVAGRGVMADVLITGVSVLGRPPTDLLLRDGIVAEVGTGLSAPGALVVEADGLVALPGLVDLHTHLREPGREDAETVETGSRAAALGGYTA